MSLRTQLILAFFLMAVLPLTGLTLYSYWSSISAFKKVVEAESAALAEDVGERMELATRDLNRRVERLGSLPFMNLLEGTRTEEQAADPSRFYARLMEEMGEAAALVDSFEFKPMVHEVRPGKPGEHLSHGETAKPRPLPPPPAPPPPSPEGLGAVVIRMRQGEQPGSTEETRVMMDVEIHTPVGDSSGLTVARTGDDRLVVLPSPSDRTLASAGDAGPGARQGAARAQQELKRLEQVSRELEEKTARVAEAVAQGDPGARRRLESLVRKSAGVAARREKIKVQLDTQFRCPVEDSGQTVGTVLAKVNPQMVLHSVLNRTRGDQGEIPFAVDSEGNVYTPNPEKMESLEELQISSAGLAAGSVQTARDWVVATRGEPIFGLTFGVARPVGEAIQEIRHTAVRNLGYGMAMILVAVLGILPLSRRMTRNLTALSTGAERLAEGELDVEVPVRSHDEFGKLAETFNRMARDLKRHQRDLVEQERLRKELEMCRHIQEEMLPRAPLRLPLAQVKGVSIPAREVGGDFFNYFPVPGDQVALVIGDVSGKGVAAALLMANIQATLRARLSVTRDLAALAAELDREIYAQTPPEAYLTLFMGILDSDCRSLIWVNAGHTPQFALRSAGEIVRLPSTGRPLGLVPGGGYECGTLDLWPGDSIFLYTDGLVEAQNAEGEDFGQDRLESVLADAMSSEPDALLSRVEEESRRHRGSKEAADDATMMVLKIAAQ